MDNRDFRILHPHDNEWVTMSRKPHDAADLDVERKWGAGAVLYKCDRCDEGIIIQPTAPMVPRP
jgi:hypothetical protein